MVCLTWPSASLRIGTISQPGIILTDIKRQSRADSIADLLEFLLVLAAEVMCIRESLHPRILACGKGTSLARVLILMRVNLHAADASRIDLVPPGATGTHIRVRTPRAHTHTDLSAGTAALQNYRRPTTNIAIFSTTLLTLSGGCVQLTQGHV
jgi:hypothetical protein